MIKTYFHLFTLLSLALAFFLSCKPSTDKSVNKDSTNTIKESTSALEIKSVDAVLPPDEMKRLNIFFSNFSEVNLKPFLENKITDEELINFGILHIYKNNYNLLEKVDNFKSKIQAEKVNEASKKYFGINIGTHKTTTDYKFINGYYFIPLADGESYNFSQVERLTDIGSDKYIAYINVYSASSGWSGNTQASIKEWKENGEELPELTGKYKAAFEKKNTGNILLYYTKQ